MTGITGWRRATASEPRRPARYHAALPKAHFVSIRGGCDAALRGHSKPANENKNLGR